MTWRLAKSLDTLRSQIDALAPGRNKFSDGTIGDSAHQARHSDHNPDAEGVVRALDITHDPAHGVDTYVMAEIMRLAKDPRISYIISDIRICNSKIDPWEWRPYTGSDQHTEHIHISVVADDTLADDTRPWVVSGNTAAVPIQSGKGSWYSQFSGKHEWVDPNDKPNSNALGVPDSEQGISFYSRGTLGKWFDVTAPNGIALSLRQTDIGPNPNTGRSIDIAAAAAERFGYSPSDFPTDGIFHWRPVIAPAPAPKPAPAASPAPPVAIPAATGVDWVGLAREFAPVAAQIIKALAPVAGQIIKTEAPAAAPYLGQLFALLMHYLPNLAILFGGIPVSSLQVLGVLGPAFGAAATPVGGILTIAWLGMLGIGVLNRFTPPVKVLQGGGNFHGGPKGN